MDENELFMKIALRMIIVAAIAITILCIDGSTLLVGVVFFLGVMASLATINV